jgi:hypothetical protein
MEPPKEIVPSGVDLIIEIAPGADARDVEAEPRAIGLDTIGNTRRRPHWRNPKKL